MNAATRTTAVAAGCAMLLLTACRDRDAVRRAEAQAVIDSATRQIQQLTAVLDDPKQAADARRQLKGIIAKLAETRDAAPGQRAAAASIAAGMHRRLATLATAEAVSREIDLRNRRGVLMGMIDAADQLDAMAAGLEAIDIDQAEATLTAAGDEAKQILATAGSRLADLDGPIAEINEANSKDQDETQKLRGQATDLRREAAELGPAAGYSAFEEAQRLDREADGVELDLAHRELDLRYNYEPEHALAQTRADRMRDRLTSLDAARQTLRELHATALGEAETTRAKLDELSASINVELDEIQASANELSELYDQAQDELGRAAGQSKAAAGLGDRDFADAARIDAAEAYLQLGSLHRTRAHGLQDQIRLMTRASEILGTSPAGTDDLRSARRDQLSKAAEAYANGAGELGRVSGRTARERLEALKMSVSALEKQEPAPAATPAKPAAGSAAPAASPTGGAESPQALLAAMLDDAHPDPLDLWDFGTVTPAQARLVESFKASQRAQAEMAAALRERFADQIATADGSVLAAMANRDLALGAVEGDEGTINRTITGMTIPMHIVRVDGRWYIDGSALLTESAGQAQAMGLTPAQLLDMMTPFMHDLAGRIRAGELGSLQEADIAFMQGLAGNFRSGS